jgi:hypothetical protein
MTTTTLKKASILEEPIPLAFFTIHDNQMPNKEACKYLHIQGQKE